MLRHLRRIKKYLHSILDIAGITNYPIGVGINAAGEITIADNHNNFNLSVFSQDGQLISALESKVRTYKCTNISHHYPYLAPGEACSVF